MVEVKKLVCKRIFTQEGATRLEREFSDDEISQIVLDSEDDKSPGSDGVNSLL